MSSCHEDIRRLWLGLRKAHVTQQGSISCCSTQLLQRTLGLGHKRRLLSRIRDFPHLRCFARRSSLYPRTQLTRSKVSP